MGAGAGDEEGTMMSLGRMDNREGRDSTGGALGVENREIFRPATQLATVGCMDPWSRSQAVPVQRRCWD